jgi:hypothetical protein
LQFSPVNRKQSAVAILAGQSEAIRRGSSRRSIGSNPPRQFSKKSTAAFLAGQSEAIRRGISRRSIGSNPPRQFSQVNPKQSAAAVLAGQSEEDF